MLSELLKSLHLLWVDGCHVPLWVIDRSVIVECVIDVYASVVGDLWHVFVKGMMVCGCHGDDGLWLSWE